MFIISKDHTADFVRLDIHNHTLHGILCINEFHQFSVHNVGKTVQPADAVGNAQHAAELILADGHIQLADAVEQIGGKPAFVEEHGSRRQEQASQRHVADYMRNMLWNVWDADCRGMLWWCAFDQTGMEIAPYDWKEPCVELGIFRRDRTPYPALKPLRDFAKLQERLPFAALPKAKTRAVVLAMDADVVHSSYILARQAGFFPRFASPEGGIPDADCYFVPFMDKDGVEEGDQGKNRPPHDHNRDYGAFVHPETKAMTEWARDHAGNNIAIYLDLHCPWIRGKPTNECLYTPFKAPKWYRSSACEKADRRFSQTLERVQCGSFRYKASDDLDYGRFWNTGKNYEQGGPSTWWGITHFTGLVSRCLEVPFQTANGAVVTRETCRDLGRDVAKTLRETIAP